MENYSLVEDDIMLSQQYCCLSFVEPETKGQVEMNHNIHKFVNTFMKDLINVEYTYDYIKTEINDYRIIYYTKLIEKVDENPIHGIKIRGIYKNEKKARQRISELEKKYKDIEPVPIYICSVGKWCPFMSKDINIKTVSSNMNYTLWDHQEKKNREKHEFNNRQSSSKDEYVEVPYDESNDYLDEDAPLHNQYYCCVSFLEPSVKNINKFNELLTEHFLYDYCHEKYDAHYKTTLDEEKYPEFPFTKEELYNKYLNSSITRLNKLNKLNLSMCFKVRGVFSSHEKAKKHIEMLKNSDKNNNVFIGLVGHWLPFNPVAVDDIETEYADNKISTIMKALEKVDSEKDKAQNVLEEHEDTLKRLERENPSSNTEEMRAVNSII